MIGLRDYSDIQAHECGAVDTISEGQHRKWCKECRQREAARHDPRVMDEDEQEAVEKAAENVSAFAWDKTPEGSDYWDDVFYRLNAMAENGTYDGKPWSEADE